MKKQVVNIWVVPEYKRMIKLEATKKDMTILQYTEKIVEENDEKNGKKKFRFTL